MTMFNQISKLFIIWRMLLIRYVSQTLTWIVNAFQIYLWVSLEISLFQLHPGALFLLGAVYLTGDCVKKDVASALWCFHRASEKVKKLFLFVYWIGIGRLTLNFWDSKAFQFFVLVDSLIGNVWLQTPSADSWQLQCRMGISVKSVPLYWTVVCSLTDKSTILHLKKL